MESESDEPIDLKRKIPESWHCVDCGFNTAPGLFNRAEMEKAIAEAKAAGKWDDDYGIGQQINDQSEVYTVCDVIWEKAGIVDGCLCIGCLEKRLGRPLTPKDFLRGDPFNELPGTERLLSRQKRNWWRVVE